MIRNKLHKQDTHIAENLPETNPSADYSYFAIWKEARPYLSEIRAYLSNRFEILLETKIIWSEAHFRENTARLYEVPLYENSRDEAIPVAHTHKIGDTAFTVLVVKDATPRYHYHPSVSGKIELCNSAIVEAKETFRAWVAKNSEVKYAVHSSNNFEEFCFQIPLLLGVAHFNSLISGKKIDLSSLQKDLEGAGGWDTAEAMFAVLNCATKYVLLRNFETVAVISSLDDLDFLTNKYQRLASVIGLKQNATKPYKGTVAIENINIPVDIRFVGDNYYCSAWAGTILRNKIISNGIYIPAKDDYFFTLLYHVAVHKQTIDSQYKIKLNALAKELKLYWFSEEIFQEQQKVATVLHGYMTTNGYFYERPIDAEVYENKNVTSQLPKRSYLVASKNLKLKIKQALLPFIPKRWYFYYLKVRTGKVYDSNK